MKNFKTLILDRKSVMGLVDMKKSIKAVEDAFREYGARRAQMPPKIYLHLGKFRGDFRAMPAYMEGLGKSSLKWVSVYPNNKKFALPVVMAVIVLSNAKNGFPLCIMDGTVATGFRTGAAGGVAAKYLARPDSKVIGLVGCGAQARTQFLALMELFDIVEVKVWGHRYSLIRDFINDTKVYGIKFTPAENIKGCVKDCDIICTTTPSRKPVVKAEWIRKGTHINAMGADAVGKQELDPAILKNSKVVIDSWEQARHSGEINVPLRKKLISKRDIYADIGEIVSGRKTGRSAKNEITVFDSTGLAIQDAAIANLIYNAALRKKRGLWIKLI